MSKVLLGLVGLGLLLLVGFHILAFLIFSMPIASQPTNCSTPTVVSQSKQVPESSTRKSVAPPCIPESVSQQRQQTNALRQAGLANERASLTFPTSLEVGGNYISFIGLIFVCILVGTLIGSEYRYGTLRFALMRGTSSIQLVVAQILTLGVLAFVLVYSIELLMGLVGITLGPALGGVSPVVPANGWEGIVAYILTLSLQLFTYSLLAFFLATLGRSTTLGIVGVVVYVLLEKVALPIITALSNTFNNSGGHILHAFSEVFLSPNFNTLETQFAHTPVNFSSSNETTITATLVALTIIFLYCIILVAGSLLLLSKRDLVE